MTSPTISVPATPAAGPEQDVCEDSGGFGFATAFNVGLWKAQQQSWIRAQLRKSRHEIEACVRREVTEKQKAKMQELERVHTELTAMAERLRAAGEALQKRVHQFEARERAFEARRVKLAEQHESQMALAETRVQRVVQEAAASREAMQIQLDERTRALTHTQERLRVAESEFDLLRRRAAQQLSCTDHSRAEQQAQQTAAAELAQTRSQLQEVQLCLRHAQSELDRRCAELEQRSSERVSLERELCVCQAELTELRARHAALQKSWHVREHDYLRAAQLALERERNERQHQQEAAAASARANARDASAKRAWQEGGIDVPSLIARLRRDIVAEMRAHRRGRRSRLRDAPRSTFDSPARRGRARRIARGLPARDSESESSSALQRSNSSSRENDVHTAYDVRHTRSDGRDDDEEEEEGVGGGTDYAVPTHRRRARRDATREGVVFVEYPPLVRCAPEAAAAPTRREGQASDGAERSATAHSAHDASEASHNRDGEETLPSAACTWSPSRHDEQRYADAGHAGAGRRDAASSLESSGMEAYARVQVPTWSSSEEDANETRRATGPDGNTPSRTSSSSWTYTASPRVVGSREHAARNAETRAAAARVPFSSSELPPRVPLSEEGHVPGTSDRADVAAVRRGVSSGTSRDEAGAVCSSPTPDEFARAATQSADEAGTTRADMLIFVDQMKSNRQKLLDTGVYTASDAVIREMDEKIRHYETYLSKYF